MRPPQLLETKRNLALKASKTTCRGQSYPKTGTDITCCQNISAAGSDAGQKYVTISSTPTGNITYQMIGDLDFKLSILKNEIFRVF